MVPTHVQGVALGTSSILGIVGLGDWMGLGHGAMSKACTSETGFTGALLVSKSVFTLVTIFSNRTEGTFLRRNLLLAIGICDMGLLANLVFANRRTCKASLWTGIVFALEATVFIHDALFRKRQAKHR